MLARSVAWPGHWPLDRLQTLRVVTGQDLVRTPPIVAGEWGRWPQGEGRQVMTTTITIVSRLKWSIFAALCLQWVVVLMLNHRLFCNLQATFFKIYWKENLEFGHQCENSPLFTGNMFRLDITPLCVSIPILLCVRLCVRLCDSGVETETGNNQAVRL